MRRLALVALFAIACGSSPASGPSLKLIFHTGDVYRYSYESNGHSAIDPSPPDAVHKTAYLAFTVKAVHSDATADLSLEASDVVATLIGVPIPPPAGTSFNGTSDLKVRSDGRVLSETVNGAQFGGGIWWAVLPSMAVKPGDTWRDAFDESVSYSGSSVTGQFKTGSKYLRNESFHGANAAVVESTFAATTIAPPTAGISVSETSTTTITTWIDRGAGRILKSHLVSSYVGTFTDLSGLIAPTTVRGDEIADLLPV